jgi:hypothetical protein
VFPRLARAAQSAGWAAAKAWSQKARGAKYPRSSPSAGTGAATGVDVWVAVGFEVVLVLVVEHPAAIIEAAATNATTWLGFTVDYFLPG